MTRRRLGYLMSRFPNLTETFILREIVVLALGGWPISIYPLIVQAQPVTHPDAAAWLGRVTDVPFVSWPCCGRTWRQRCACRSAT